MKLNEVMKGRTAVRRGTIVVVMILAFGASCTSANEQSNELFARDDSQSVNHMTEVSQINIEADDASSGVDSIAWDPPSSMIVVLTNQGTNIQAYDTRSWMLRANFDQSEYGMGYKASLFFTHRGIVAAGFTDRSQGYRPALATWDLSTGKQVQRLPRLSRESRIPALGSSRAFNVSRDGQLVAVSMQGVKSPELHGPAFPETISVVATQNGSELRSISLPQIAWVGPSSLSFTPDAKRLAIGSWSGSVVLVDLRTGRLDTIVPDRKAGRPASLAFSSNGEIVAVGYAPMNDEQPFAGVVELWSVATKVRLATLDMPIFSYHGKRAQPEVYSLAWDWTHDRLAAGASDSVRVWSNMSGKPELQFSQRMPTNGAGFVSYLPYDVTFSNTGTLAIATGRTIKIYR